MPVKITALPPTRSRLHEHSPARNDRRSCPRRPSASPSPARGAACPGSASLPAADSCRLAVARSLITRWLDRAVAAVARQDPFQLRDLLAQRGDPVGLRAHRLAQFLGQVPKLRDPFLPCGAPGAVLWGIRRCSTADIAHLYARLGADGRLRPVEGLRTQPGSRQSRRWGHSRVLVPLPSADGQHLINSLWQSDPWHAVRWPRLSALYVGWCLIQLIRVPTNSTPMMCKSISHPHSEGQ